MPGYLEKQVREILVPAALSSPRTIHPRLHALSWYATYASRPLPSACDPQDDLKKRGIDEVLVYCVNDGAVMTGWAQDQKIEGSNITFLGDPHMELTNLLGMVLDHPGPKGKGLLGRCKRFGLYLEDGVIKVWNVSEGPDDPAGDDNPYSSTVEGMLADIDEL